ncbi:putative Gnk2-like domain-containing protein [Helianthus annuus]|nr:putative Gnk2-like domain-containing protein [Helianthus annuus]
MFQEVFCLSFFIFSLVLSLLSVCTAYSNVYLKCSQVNFTSMTPYESNVNSLFTSLVDSASLYNFNKFETSPQNDGVYGLFQCRGDLSSPNCKECVASSVGQLKTTCSLSIGGEIQLEECFVKYDDTSFFGAQDKMELVGTDNTFVGGDFGSIQGVAQCVQDLSLSDCQDCLAEASGRLRSGCETSTWGDMYLGKCYIRYADQGKYVCGRHGNGLVNNGNSTSNSSNSRASKDDIMKWIGYIIAAVVTALGAGVGVTFACKNTNKNKNANENKNSIENRNGT